MVRSPMLEVLSQSCENFYKTSNGRCPAVCTENLIPLRGRANRVSWSGDWAPLVHSGHPGLAMQIGRAADTPLWGAPRIHGELLKLGFEVAQSTVAKYMIKRSRGPGQSWWTFLRNHAPEIAAMDLFVVPTLAFSLIYGFVIVRLDRRQLVWIAVTSSPTAEWIARQVTEAFPWDSTPQHLVRDRDSVFGFVVRHRLRAMGIRDKPIAPRSPWQNGFAERLIGSIRRECLVHTIIFGEAHLRHLLRAYASYYNATRTHRSLDKDAPVHRPVQLVGSLKSRPILGGLHHQYVRIIFGTHRDIQGL